KAGESRLISCRGVIGPLSRPDFGPPDARHEPLLLLDAGRALTLAPDRTVHIWSLKEGRSLATLAGLTGRPPCVALSGDVSRLVPPGPDGLIVWDARTGKELRRIKAAGDCVRLALSADGRRVAAARGDNSLWLWEGDGEPRRLR